MAWLGWFLVEYFSSNFPSCTFLRRRHNFRCHPKVAVEMSSECLERSFMSAIPVSLAQTPLRLLSQTNEAYWWLRLCKLSTIICFSHKAFYFIILYAVHYNSRILIYFDQHLKEALLRPRMLESFIK